MRNARLLGFLRRKEAIVILVLFIFALFLVITLYLASQTCSNSPPNVVTTAKIRDLRFQYIVSSKCDFKTMFSQNGNETEILHTDVYQYRSEEGMQRMIKRAGLTFSERVDFSENSVIVSFGREIYNMEECYEDPSGLAPYLVLTFSSQYNVDTAYLYLIANRGFAPCDIAAHCSIKKDEQIVFVGMNTSRLSMTNEEVMELFK